MKRLLFLFFLSTLVGSIFASNLKTVTYTIRSKTEVLAEGDEPIGSMATYEQTGTNQKGQMTGGNSTTFTLTGVQGLQLHKVELQMRSNTKAGAGSLQMTAGNNTLWEIPTAKFNDAVWYGAWSTAFVPIEWQAESVLTLEETSNTLTIHIAATENSLYISSYTFYYSAKPTQPATVEFYTNTDIPVPAIQEAAIGGGIVLPECPVTDSVWYFIGWTEETVPLTEDKGKLPEIFAPETVYHPLGDCTLYALYSDFVPSSAQWLQDTILQSGYYLMTDSLFDAIAVGGLNDKKKILADSISLTQTNENGWHIFPGNEYPAEAVYFIEFNPEDSTATIQHFLSETYVGYETSNTNTLKDKKTAWNYRVIRNKQVIFYHNYGNVQRQLRAFPNTLIFYWEAARTTENRHGNILFNIEDCPETVIAHYTSFPFRTGLTSVLPASIKITPTGVENPQALPLVLYDISGRMVVCCEGDLSFLPYPCGVYMLQVANKGYKVLIQH